MSYRRGLYEDMVIVFSVVCQKEWVKKVFLWRGLYGGGLYAVIVTILSVFRPEKYPRRRSFFVRGSEKRSSIKSESRSCLNFVSEAMAKREVLGELTVCECLGRLSRGEGRKRWCDIGRTRWK